MVLLRAYTDGDNPFIPDAGDDPFNTDPGNDPGAGPGPVTPPTGTGLVNSGIVTGGDFGTGLIPGGTGKGGGGGGGYGIGYGFPSFDVGKVPGFVAPKFTLPTAESVLNMPGYKFREQQGRDALEHSAAARGLTRTGGTLKDLSTWNQGFASQEYDAEARRQLGAFQANYQGAKDEYAPQFANWQFLSNAALQKALAEYGRGTVWNNPNSGGGGGGGGGILSYEEWKQQNGYA